MGRPKVLKPCKYCFEMLGVNEMNNHRGQCPKNPRRHSLVKPRDEYFGKITCSFCHTEQPIRKFQGHVRECSLAPQCGDGERICTFCQVRQPVANFLAGTKLDYRCRDCGIKLSRNWYAANKTRARETMLAWRFGITREAYDQMFLAQHGRCAICGRPPDSQGKYNKKNLAVDHDHASGKVRDLLCHHCNNGLGCFRDNVDLLWKAISYLDRHRLVPEESQD